MLRLSVAYRYALALSIVLASGCGDADGIADGSIANGGGPGTTGAGGQTTGGSGGGGGESAGGGGDGGQGGTIELKTPVIVAVGYGGRRMRSTDLGLTWEALTEDEAEGGDDQNLLRAAVFSNGLFIAAGWRIHTSPNGVDWTERTVEGQQWCGGLAAGNGIVLCAGGCGESLVSTDGTNWSSADNATPGGCAHIRSLAFGAGRFVATGDNARMVTTTDGSDWTDLPDQDVGTVVFRDDAFYANGDGFYIRSTDGLTWDTVTGQAMTEAFGHDVFVRGQWKGKIDRSVDGTRWNNVYDDAGNHLSAFAFGSVDR